MKQDKKEDTINRIKFFDIAKGISIICVIIGHMGIEKIDKIVFSFHMPIFFLISGYFISNKNIDTKSLISKKSHQLLGPYLFTCICIIGLSIINDILLGNSEMIIGNVLAWVYASIYGSGTTWFEPFYVKQIGAIWFLLALYIAIVIVNYLIKYRYKHIYIYIAVLAYIGYKTAQYIWLPFSIQAGLTAILFVYLGYEAKQNRILEINLHPFVRFCLIGIWIFSIIFGDKLLMVKNYYPNGFLDIISALSASYIVILCSKTIESKMGLIGNIFEFYGKNSLIILCAHLIELNMFQWWIIYDFMNSIGKSNTITVLLIISLKFLWCTLFVIVVHKVHLLGKIFGIKDCIK